MTMHAVEIMCSISIALDHVMLNQDKITSAMRARRNPYFNRTADIDCRRFVVAIV